MRYDIRRITEYRDYKAAEELQAEALGFDPLDIVPYSVMQSWAKSGGAVIGAFERDHLIGVVMGYAGLSVDGTPYHRSQRMAVLQSHRGMGVGSALKLAQAEVARNQRLKLMCWTYDPLRAPNAYLNLHKLGAISRRYLRDAYAVSSSPRDEGASIDRVWVEWDLERPAQYQLQSIDERLPVVLIDQDGFPSQPDLTCTAPQIIVPIPHDIDVTRSIVPTSLRQWRAVTAEVFEHYFSKGYLAIDFVPARGYVLSRISS